MPQRCSKIYSFMNIPHSSIPVTIVTGFLGSGKTTFINELTARHADTRFAIIENEFGKVSIDEELLIGGNEGIFEINGGCICCTVSDELISYLLKLNSGQRQFDHLIIETTGIAEPLSIAEPFMAHPVIQKKYRLDSIICLVDSEFIADQLKEEEVAARQISAADVVIFNKTDSVAAEYLEELQTNIRQINPYAQMVQAAFAKVADANLLNLQANTPEVVEKRQENIDLHHQHLHNQISSYTICFTESLDYAKFYQWASRLMMFQNSRIYRIKGILNFENEENKAVFQSVKTKFVLSKGNPWPGDKSAVRESKLVFIGRELKKEQLLKHLKQCFAKKG